VGFKLILLRGTGTGTRILMTGTSVGGPPVGFVLNGTEDDILNRPIFRKIEEFFHLLDLHRNGYINMVEVRKSLMICFSKDPGQNQFSSLDTVKAVIEKQINWLFQKVGSGSSNERSISLASFQLMYKELLANGYEEEVLNVDLDKALSTLSVARASYDEQFEHLLTKAARLYCLMATCCKEEKDKCTESKQQISREQATKSLRLIHRAIASPKLAPPSMFDSDDDIVEQRVQWLFAHTKPNYSDHFASTISLEEFIQCYKTLLAEGYEPEVLHIDLDRGIKTLESAED